MDSGRKIIHIDMDAFYASVEQRDNPELRGKPVVVGGDPEKRGVVSTASYEARAFGIHSAMPTSTAKRRCPHAIFVRTRMDVYVQVSREIMEILRSYAELVQPVSIDEAYLDVTENKKGIAYASQIAREIREEIRQRTELTASAGVGPNKFIAKIASDMDKPDGLTVIRPEDVEALLEDLPVRKVPGIGKVTNEKMEALGIHTVGGLRRKSEEELVAAFGKAGTWYYSLSRGQDDRAVGTSGVRKSISAERTFAEDVSELSTMRDALRTIARQLEGRMAKTGAKGKTITLKITYADFKKNTRSETQGAFVEDEKTLYETAARLLGERDALDSPVRLLGIGVSNLDNQPAPVETPSAQLTFPFFHLERYKSG
jgi:DNA polymerase-4